MKAGRFIVVIAIALAAAAGAYILAGAGVSSLREEITRLKNDLQDTNTKLAAAESEIGKLTGVRNKLETEIQTLSETCGRLSEQVARLKRDQGELSSKVDKLSPKARPKEPAVIKPPEPAPAAEQFDYDRLRGEAGKLHDEASALFNKAMELKDGEEKDAALEKAGEKCEQAVERLEKIRQFYEDNNLRPKEGNIFEWESLYQRASVLLYEITKSKGF
jgi:chromosome segregation ATPase